MRNIALSNGVGMPQIGYGVFQIGGDECARCVREAIETGYRLIDTAQSYFNETEVGEGIRQSGIDRKDLFVTTKVWISNYGYENTLRSIDDSLRKLGTDISTSCCCTSRSQTVTGRGMRSRSFTMMAWFARLA